MKRFLYTIALSLILTIFVHEDKEPVVLNPSIILAEEVRVPPLTDKTELEEEVDNILPTGYYLGDHLKEDEFLPLDGYHIIYSSYIYNKPNDEIVDVLIYTDFDGNIVKICDDLGYLYYEMMEH